MWPEARDKVNFELSQLRLLLDFHRDLLTNVQGRDPDGTELTALSAFLHSYYTGIEKHLQENSSVD